MDRAADAETARLRHLEELHHHALAGEGGVAVQDDRQDLLALLVVAPELARTHAAHDHRIHDFQMRRVERQRQVDRAAGSGDVGGEAHVVLHVAGVRVAAVAGVLELAFELVEQLARRLAHRVDQHVEAAAVGHADHDVLDPVAAGALDHHVQQRDQAVAAFQREALLADVLGVQVALEALGGGQALEDALLVVGAATVVAGGLLQAFVHPAALFGVGDVHELCADAAGIGRLQQVEQFAQLHPLAATDATGAELAAGVALGQAMEAQRQVRCFGLDGQAERIQVGGEVPARPVRRDQLADPAFALVAGARCGRDHAARGQPAGLGDLPDDRGVRDVAGFAALEPIEILSPLGIDAVRRDQVLLVEILHIGAIGAELRGLGKLLQETVHHGVASGLAISD